METRGTKIYFDHETFIAVKLKKNRMLGLDVFAVWSGDLGFFSASILI